MLADIPILKGEMKTEMGGKLPTGDGPRWWRRTGRGFNMRHPSPRRTGTCKAVHNIILGAAGEDGGDLGHCRGQILPNVPMKG